MASPSRGVAVAAYVTAGTIWGTTFIFMRWATDVVSVGQTTLLRVLFGAIPIAAFAIGRGHIRWRHVRHLHHFLVMSVLAAAFYYYAFAAGTELLETGIAGALSGTIPLFATLAAGVALPDEQLTWGRLAGLAAGLVGVALLAQPWTADVVDPLGVAWMLLGAASVGFSFVYARRFIAPLGVHPAASTTYQMTLAVLVLLPITDLHGITRIADDPQSLWGTVLGLGLASTGIAFVLYYVTVDRLGATTASTVSYLPPAIAMVVGIVVLDEPVRWVGIIGLGAIGAGAVVSHVFGHSARNVPSARVMGVPQAPR